MLWIDCGPAFDMKVFEFGVFCAKYVRVAALSGLKPGYYNRILLLAEADDVLEAHFVTNPALFCEIK